MDNSACILQEPFVGATKASLLGPFHATYGILFDSGGLWSMILSLEINRPDLLDLHITDDLLQTADLLSKTGLLTILMLLLLLFSYLFQGVHL